jgi:hypothetical protein
MPSSDLQAVQECRHQTFKQYRNAVIRPSCSTDRMILSACASRITSEDGVYDLKEKWKA